MRKRDILFFMAAGAGLAAVAYAFRDAFSDMITCECGCADEDEEDDDFEDDADDDLFADFDDEDAQKASDEANGWKPIDDGEKEPEETSDGKNGSSRGE